MQAPVARRTDPVVAPSQMGHTDIGENRTPRIDEPRYGYGEIHEMAERHGPAGQWRNCVASVAIVDSTPEYLLFDLISLLLFVCCDFAIGYCVCRSGGELQSLKSKVYHVSKRRIVLYPFGGQTVAS